MLLKSNEFLDHVQHILHKETQKHEKRIDLTLSKVYRLKSRGSLDFGGSEFTNSTIEKISPEKESSEDKYGWWNLKEGIYKIEFNEELIQGHGVIQSLPRLLQTGCFLPMQIIDEGTIESVLIVEKNGVALKENARVAGLLQIS